MTDHGTHLDQMRAQAPLVHNITNYVAMNIMANVLLAVGASPAMVHARQEVAEFAGLAQALTVNIGTADPDWVEAMALQPGSGKTPARGWSIWGQASFAATHLKYWRWPGPPPPDAGQMPPTVSPPHKRPRWRWHGAAGRWLPSLAPRIS